MNFIKNELYDGDDFDDLSDLIYEEKYKFIEALEELMSSFDNILNLSGKINKTDSVLNKIENDLKSYKFREDLPVFDFKFINGEYSIVIKKLKKEL